VVVSAFTVYMAMVYFALGSRADALDMTAEIQIYTGHGVVEIHADLFFSDIQYLTVDHVSFLVAHGDGFAFL
jgi:hypothetical protein